MSVLSGTSLNFSKLEFLREIELAIDQTLIRHSLRPTTTLKSLDFWEQLALWPSLEHSRSFGGLNFTWKRWLFPAQIFTILAKLSWKRWLNGPNLHKLRLYVDTELSAASLGKTFTWNRSRQIKFLRENDGSTTQIFTKSLAQRRHGAKHFVKSI